MLKIDCLFQNEDFMVVNKPENLNFHSENSPGLAVLVQQQFNLAEIYPVHRLDKMTSGLVIFALNQKVTNQFRVLFEQHLIQKYYLAVSLGKPKKKQGWIKGDMAAARRGSWKLLKTQLNPAITQFISSSIRPGERGYLLKPFTGKTHQLRVALKSLGVPICGDLRYQALSEAKLEDRGYLHAYALQFNWNGRAYCFVQPPKTGLRFLSDDFQCLLKQWKIPWERL